MVRDHLESHASLKHEGRKPYECMNCGKLLGYASSLREHLKICERRMLQASIKAAQAVITPKCNICNKEYSSEKSLKVHNDAVHKTNVEYGCQICGKIFKYRSSRDRHERVHMLKEANSGMF